MSHMRLCSVVALLLIVLTSVISAQQSPAFAGTNSTDSRWLGNL